MRNREPQTGNNLVKMFLRNACSLLLERADSGSAPLGGVLAAAESFMEKGQFELALDALAEAGHTATPRAKFWNSLSKAAGELGLHKKAMDFQFLWVEAASLALGQNGNTRKRPVD